MSDRPRNLFDLPEREIAESEHPHWSQPRIPTRKVRRRLARKAGMFRPYRHSRGKGHGPRQPYYHAPNLKAGMKNASAAEPSGIIPSIIGRLRRGADR